MEDLVLQNMQARTRLVSSYMIAQALQAKGLSQKFFLVIGSGNCSEINRGYFTKYDNSSGDINFIGDLCKQDIYKMINYFHKEGSHYYKSKAGKEYDPKRFSFLKELLTTKPTAELRPKGNNSIGIQIQLNNSKNKLMNKKWGYHILILIIF